MKRQRLDEDSTEMVVENIDSTATKTSPIAAWQEAENFFHAGRLADAEAICRQLLRRSPGDADTLDLLSRITRAAGNPVIAEAFARRATKVQPNTAQFHRTLGKALQAQGKFDGAVASFERAIELDPTLIKAYVNLGSALRERGEPARADACLRRVVELTPDSAPAYLQLGLALEDQFQYVAAEECLERAVTLAPSDPAAQVCLAGSRLNQGRFEEANVGFRHALTLDENCAETHSNILFTSHYLPSCDRERLYAEARAWDARFAAPLNVESRSHANVADPNRRLRVGYVSGDFHRHPVGYFVEAVLRSHDKEQFEIFCYSAHRSADDLTKRLIEAADHARLLAGIDDKSAANAIRRDGIDILVDLSGHTGWHRLLMFARRPAPVQVTWIGYFDTTGLSSIDYILLDRHICPAGNERLFSEQVVKLPDSYMCYAPQTTFDVGPLPASTNGYVTFGCFNKLAKANQEVRALWAQILHEVPEARLCLKDVPFTETSIRQRWERIFAELGIAADRLTFLGRTPYDEHQQCYRQIDIALDPFPFNGGTTTVEALWMGVPVITLAGDHFVSRMGVSHLHGVGLPELIASTREDYVAKAVNLARDLPRLTALRAGLRDQMANSPLCDGPRFTRNLEAAYRSMWQAWCTVQGDTDE